MMASTVNPLDRAFPDDGFAYQWVPLADLTDFLEKWEPLGEEYAGLVLCRRSKADNDAASAAMAAKAIRQKSDDLAKYSSKKPEVGLPAIPASARPRLVGSVIIWEWGAEKWVIAREPYRDEDRVVAYFRRSESGELLSFFCSSEWNGEE